MRITTTAEDFFFSGGGGGVAEREDETGLDERSEVRRGRRGRYTSGARKKDILKKTR